MRSWRAVPYSSTLKQPDNIVFALLLVYRFTDHLAAGIKQEAVPAVPERRFLRRLSPLAHAFDSWVAASLACHGASSRHRPGSEMRATRPLVAEIARG